MPLLGSTTHHSTDPFGDHSSALPAQMAAEGKREVAEQRLRQAQEQLAKAGDAAAVANSELSELRRNMQVGGGGQVHCVSWRG